MYAKIFQQIYDSSVCEDWQVMITFQQLLILSNQDGVVDMTPEAISRRTNIPLEIISHGIERLEQPDNRSRCRDMDGRRIARLDEHRDWGWFIVNYRHYRQLARAEEKREADRLRIAEKRCTNNDVADSRIASQCVASSRPSEAYVEAEANTEAEATEGSNTNNLGSDVNCSAKVMRTRAKSSGKNSLDNRAKFTKPSLIEIQAYCCERRNSVEAQAFLDHYESNGWRVGRVAMRDWKAAVRTWERNNINRGNGKGDIEAQGKASIAEAVRRRAERLGLTPEELGHAE